MAKEVCKLELTPRELALILKYGYPFPEHADRLRASKLEAGWHVVRIDAYWIEMWIADLVRSAKEIESQALLDELDALCDVLENAMHHASRIRGLPPD